jgi:poly(glycerol-phosphate) alpha-glucosyltransferase
MNIGHLTSSVSRKASGPFHSVRNLAISTQKLGHHVMVFGLKDEFTEADLPAWGAVPVKTHSVVGPRRFGFSPGLVRSIQDSRIDLLHVHGVWMYPSIANLRVRRRRQVPYMVSPHGMLDPWALQNSAWKKKIATSLYEGAHLRGAGCLRALCESEAASMRALGLRNAICVIPNGQILPVESPVMDAQNRSSSTGDRKVLLFLGRLHPKKGLPDLLRAWAICQNTEPEAAYWTLAVAGGDEDGHTNLLRRMVVGLGIEKSVFFTGPLFDQRKAQAFQRAEAFILPSLSEGLPVAVLEAWSWRLPVLMTPQCNLPEGFAEGAAIRVDPNVESLTQGLRALFRMSKSEREEMAARGRRLVELRFSWPVVAEQMVSVYRWVLGAGPRPDCVRLG